MAYIGIYLNCASNKEHITNIEQLNHTVKERVRSSQAAMPFTRILKLMVVHLVATAIFWTNAFTPSKHATGLYSTKYPRKLVLGTILQYKKVLRLYLGKYFQLN